MRFSDIPTRGYEIVNPSWWNSLQQAGASIESYIGSFIPEIGMGILNAQGSPYNIDQFFFDPTVIGGFEAYYRIYRQTTGAGAVELAESGTLSGVYSPVAGTWELTQQAVGNAGVTLTITNAGQVQYTSTNITGTSNISKIAFKARTISV